MAMSAAPQGTWASLRDLLLPGLWMSNKYAGPRVVQADLSIDHLQDRLLLNVQHVIVTRSEMDSGAYRCQFGKRAMEALCAPSERLPAKSIALQRRLLMARGSQARRSRPKRIQPKKRAA